MNKWLGPLAFVGGALVVAGLWRGDTGELPLPPLVIEPSEAAQSEDCVGSCAFAHDAPPELDADRYRALLKAFAEEPMAAGSEALEELLFHHVAARPLMERLGTDPLDPERAEFLRRELSRERAWIDVRVVDAKGVERIRLRPQHVLMDHKQHLFPAEADRVQIQELEVSGTVRRVGLDHLWTRL
jgi:hypothetical protein